MPAHIICARVDADDTWAAGVSACDWFDCGINDRSHRYPSADEALFAARAGYKGPDADGIGCRIWAQRAAA